MNGIEVLKEARSRQIKTPVIILTALGELNDRLTGLNCGADDYMVKPFAFEELLARIRCLLRRPAAYNPAADAVSLGDVTFIPETRRLSSGKKDCTLSLIHIFHGFFYHKDFHPPGFLLPSPAHSVHSPALSV